MKIKFLIVAFFFLSASLYAQQTNRAIIDLINSTDDKVGVEFIPVAVDQDEIEFQIPKIVPGTYSISDFGRFISNFKAFDKNDSLLIVEKLSDNSFIKLPTWLMIHLIASWMQLYLSREAPI